MGTRRPLSEDVYDYVELKKLPKFAHLNENVQEVIKQSSWWEMYGIDWMIAIAGVFGALFSYVLMGIDNTVCLVAGFVLLAYCHCILAVKCAHAAPHDSMFGPGSKTLARLGTVFFMELVGTFSEELLFKMHIKTHHPYTNIIGLGDSSAWKAPFLPSYVYMFVMPLMSPIIALMVSIHGLWGKWLSLLRCLITMSLGLSINFALMMHVSGFTFYKALLCTLAARAVLTVPYIHVNIFQHIGLAMYSREHRPTRVYQMATSCLNLSRNIILDYCFGHSIVSCHVEHHLFPTLSDNMCLKIKPAVSKFLKENGLPYHESLYFDRLRFFIKEYERLMVHAPPITHFVGIQ